MELSVVVPTLDARDALAHTLDGLTERAGEAEVIVVNGPSSDGTTGMIQDRNDVDVLVEVADRSVSAARNAGFVRSNGDIVAFVTHDYVVQPGWRSAIEDGIRSVAAVTGPVRAGENRSDRPSNPERERIAGRDISFFSAGNVAFRGAVLNHLDGFDEYLEVGSARDLAHRLEANGFDVAWDERMRAMPCHASGDRTADDATPSLEWQYRSYAYRLVKNYNIRPATLRRLLGRAARDGSMNFRKFVGGEGAFSEWFSNGLTVVRSLARGGTDGFLARRRDRTARRNPYGLSSRADRAVSVYDWRTAKA